MDDSTSAWLIFFSLSPDEIYSRLQAMLPLVLEPASRLPWRVRVPISLMGGQGSAGSPLNLMQDPYSIKYIHIDPYLEPINAEPVCCTLPLIACNLV
ncbi:hypothetical protein JTE90_026506 [Oedothorax gibbosus]|uniref:Uncharacterized protein n=1 Tax=Oedothorax gibbosus TaxID=931172 RepID=A0AAV6VSE7_9ARAC|nr:hypothetical protein JTE90_026506 [Oedothorax gibbosus]